MCAEQQDPAWGLRGMCVCCATVKQLAAVASASTLDSLSLAVACTCLHQRSECVLACTWLLCCCCTHPRAVPSGSIVAVNCSRGVDWPSFEGCRQTFNPVLTVRSGSEVVPGSGCFASATGGVFVPVSLVGPTQLAVSAQQVQQPVCADAGAAIVTWQATTDKGSGNGGELEQLLLSNVSLPLAASPGSVTCVPFNASGPASTFWTPGGSLARAVDFLLALCLMACGAPKRRSFMLTAHPELADAACCGCVAQSVCWRPPQRTGTSP
jgi:hypothetical protein